MPKYYRLSLSHPKVRVIQMSCYGELVTIRPAYGEVWPEGYPGAGSYRNAVIDGDDLEFVRPSKLDLSEQGQKKAVSYRKKKRSKGKSSKKKTVTVRVSRQKHPERKKYPKAHFVHRDF